MPRSLYVWRRGEGNAPINKVNVPALADTDSSLGNAANQGIPGLAELQRHNQRLQALKQVND